MTSKKTILFIDGSNTYHGLKRNKLYDSFSYSWLNEELKKRYNLQKVFYYDATKSIKLEPEKYSGQQRFHQQLKKQIPGIVIKSRSLRYSEPNKEVSKAKSFSSFCKTCKLKLDSFLKDMGCNKISREKGVDIMLVTDMIKLAFHEKYDTALILTGDADFVPAIELVQTLKKEVINIHCYAGSAGELRDVCDSHILMTLNSNNECFLKF